MRSIISFSARAHSYFLLWRRARIVPTYGRTMWTRVESIARNRWRTVYSFARKSLFSRTFCELREWKPLERDLSDDWEFSLCDLISSPNRIVCISEKPVSRVKGNKFQQCKQWTSKDQFWGCKNFFDHYNATPSLEAMICQKWSVECRTWSECISQVFALIIFDGPPPTC